MVNTQFKTLSINLNVPHENGMTHFDLATNSGKLVLLLDTRYCNVLLNTGIFGLKLGLYYSVHTA